MYFDVDQGFEGPEKCLHMQFEPDAGSGSGSGRVGAGSLRDVSRERWQQMLDLTRCQILSVMSNDHCDSFVLSESSLFVFARRVILKTCGTTRLLLGIDDVLCIAAQHGLRLSSLFYIRKNFSFPGLQPFPHTSFNDEKGYLDQRFGGNAFVVGPLTNDHWFFYVADVGQDESAEKPVIFEVKMHEIDPRCSAQFYRANGLGEDQQHADAKQITRLSGIAGLIPGQTIDEHLFDPCGYSMNGLVGPWYSTIHITPEEHCSYVSFETNIPMQDYQPLLCAVLDIFRPASFTAYLMAPAQCSVLAPDSFRLVGSSSVPLLSSTTVSTWNFIADCPHDPRFEHMSRRLGRSSTFSSASAVIASSPPPSKSASSPVDSPQRSPVLPTAASPPSSPLVSGSTADMAMQPVSFYF